MAKFQANFIKSVLSMPQFKSQRVCDRVNPWVHRDIINMMYERDYIHRKAIQLKNNELQVGKI